MMRQTRISISAFCFAIIGFAAAFWAGRATAPSASSNMPEASSEHPLASRPPPHASSPKFDDAVMSTHFSRIEQERVAAALLAWLDPIQREGASNPATFSNGSMTAVRAVALLGELRYTPAADLLVRVKLEGGLGGFWEWGADVWDTTPSPDGAELARQMHESLDRPRPERPAVIDVALIQMGPPVAPGLVDGYVRQWMSPNGDHKELRLKQLEALLSTHSLCAAALGTIHNRLARIERRDDSSATTQEEIAALKRLKRGLLDKLNNPNID